MTPSPAAQADDILASAVLAEAARLMAVLPQAEQIAASISGVIDQMHNTLDKGGVTMTDERIQYAVRWTDYEPGPNGKKRTHLDVGGYDDDGKTWAGHVAKQTGDWQEANGIKRDARVVERTVTKSDWRDTK